ncbi:MAG: hypothetical protein CVT74_01875 [Alphaproteobacteria bacterium HGW-Alphaproteobacteria-13]|jgi:hypothetical protein|nr:MAG: hypothetical protein CVT74_01875 [Alphaproteobacteria bacterium HGW-Alphaproteobacteria-13]
MNSAPSHSAHFADAASVSKPGFDILLAVSDARQAALPTVRMLRTQANREAHRAHVNALTHLLGGFGAGESDQVGRPVRFFDLSDDGNGLPETMNKLFTRGFQSMLNPSTLEQATSVNPIPPTLKRWNAHD